MKYWEEARAIFQQYEFSFEDLNFTVKVDFSDILDSRHIDGRYFPEGLLSFEIELASSDTGLDNVRIINAAAIFFCETLFFCMNIGFPGSLNMLGSQIFSSGRNIDNINIASAHFEPIWDFLESYPKWSPIKILSIEDVVKWYSSLNIDMKDFALSNLERAIFSVQHFCFHSYNEDPTKIIWLTHSLESLYNITRNDSILASLKKRLELLIGLPANRKAFLKELNRFYGYRSSFVHGDLKTLRLGSSRFIQNEEIVDYQMDMWRFYNFGLFLITASLQKMIELGAKELSFDEQITFS